jgi:(2Fe-2S) ferredoxin
MSEPRPAFYAQHVFFCCNRRDAAERPSCAPRGAERVRDYAKKRIKELGLSGPGKVRVNLAGCLDRCEQGPVMVIYPEGIWYTYLDEDDVDEIIDEHILNGRPVERLLLP